MEEMSEVVTVSTEVLNQPSTESDIPSLDLQPLPNAPKDNGIKYIQARQDVEDFSGKPMRYWHKDVPIDDGIELPFELPEGETVLSLAKRADGLRKKLSNIKHAPEEYTINVDPEIAEVLDIHADDPYLDAFKHAALSHDVSQEGFNELLNLKLDLDAGMILAQIESDEKYLNDHKLNADVLLNKVNNWAEHNLSPDEVKIMNNMSLRAPELHFLNTLINKMARNQNLPGDYDQPRGLSDEDRRQKLAKLTANGFDLNKVNELYGIGS